MTKWAIVVFAYMHWEDQTRGKFAQSIGKEKNDVRSSIFADLGKLRQSFEHANGKLVRKLEYMSDIFPIVGEVIDLNSEKMRIIFSLLIEEINQIARSRLPDRISLSILDFLLVDQFPALKATKIKIKLQHKVNPPDVFRYSSHALILDFRISLFVEA
jgi:hypothetical protein